jgi:hypothetical protein
MYGLWLKRSRLYCRRESDSKSKNETAGKLGLAPGYAPLDRSVRRTSAEERSHREADYRCPFDD